MSHVVHIPYIEDITIHCKVNGIDFDALSPQWQERLEELENRQWDDLSDYLSNHPFEYFYGGGITEDMIEYFESPASRTNKGGYSYHPTPELYTLMEGIQYGGARPVITEPSLLEHIDFWHEDLGVTVIHPMRTLSKGLDPIDHKFLGEVLQGEYAVNGYGLRGKAIATVMEHTFPESSDVVAFLPSHLDMREEFAHRSIPHSKEEMPALTKLGTYIRQLRDESS